MTEARHRPRVASRRGFLAGTGLAVVSLAGGIVAGLASHRTPEPADPPNPDVLIAAADAELDLIAAIDSALSDVRGFPSELIRAMRADHEAHLIALSASVAAATGAASPSVSTPSPVPRQVLTPDQIRILSSAAAGQAAKRALELTGRDAALLASIAACEASHAELLS